MYVPPKPRTTERPPTNAPASHQQRQRPHPHLHRNPPSPPHLPNIREIRRLDPARDDKLHARGGIRRDEPDPMAQSYS